jgi:aryl-alcohol dehydrogenase-like predicted oxidoreductase
MGFDLGGDLHELALRFSAFAPGVSSTLIGTRSLEHLRQNLKLLRSGPLSPAEQEQLQSRFRDHTQDWPGQT